MASSPTSFDAILGQPGAVSVLRRTVSAGRAGSGYLFFGPDGVGKRMAATAFARALLCPRSAKTGDACEDCPSCVRSAAGSHPGLFVVECLPGKSLIGLPQIHELGRSLSLRPVEGERSVAVIDGTERMTLEASNALLKTLEEPGPGVTIVLVTSSREALPTTVRSRCQGVRFRPLALTVVEGILEGMTDWGEETCRRLALLSGGSVGRAQRLFEMDLHENSRVLEDLLSGGGPDPVAAGEALASMLGGGDLNEQRRRARELVLVLIDRIRREWLSGAGEANDPERAGFCLRALTRSIDNLNRNVDPRAVLKSALIEILPRWKTSQPT